MSNLTAALLTILVVSPSIVVLAVMIGRRVREFWTSISPICGERAKR